VAYLLASPSVFGFQRLNPVQQVAVMKNSRKNSTMCAYFLKHLKIALKQLKQKSENETKIATQLEEMKASVERMRTQAQDASEKRVASETQLIGTIDEMRKAFYLIL